MYPPLALSCATLLVSFILGFVLVAPLSGCAVLPYFFLVVVAAGTQWRVIRRPDSPTTAQWPKALTLLAALLWLLVILLAIRSRSGPDDGRAEALQILSSATAAAITVSYIARSHVRWARYVRGWRRTFEISATELGRIVGQPAAKDSPETTYGEAEDR